MKPSSEALLISALINTGDTSLGSLHGVEPEMFVGYQAEYRWVLSYAATYRSAPGWDAFMAKFPDFPVTDHSDAAFAADEVRYSAGQRSLRAAVRAAAMSISEGDYEEAAMALSSYTPLSALRAPVNALADLSFLDTYEERPEVVELPWKTPQMLTGGIRAGDLWFLAARLGQGKTWTAIDLLAHALMNGHRCNLFSLEMTRAQVMTRLHVALGQRLGFDVDHVAMRDRVYDVIAYRKIVSRIREEVPGELFVYDSTDGRISPATVASRTGGIDLNVIDYAGLMSSPMGKRAVDDWRVMAAISNELKEVATSKGTRIVSLAQINRDGDSISKYPPKTKNLAQSDALGQDGDVVVTMKRFSTTSQINSLEKNRHGADGKYFYTRFLPNEGRFHEISKEYADQLRDQEDVDD